MIDEQIGTAVSAKKKKKIISCILAILGSLTPAIAILLCVLLLGSGIFGAFSMVGGFLSGLFGSNDTDTLIERTGALNSLTEKEVLELVKSDKIDESYYDTMMISKDELEYLLEQVIEYNSQSVERTIEIECEHIYTTWIEDEALPTGGYTEKRTEYPYRTITVRSKDIETFHLDWQLVYALCLTDIMNGVEEWKRDSAEGEEKGILRHYGPDHDEIDYIISNVKMTYEYVTDLARSSKTKYSMEECKRLVHTTYKYGDASTSEGQWTYYYPHSVLERAYSGYSCMYYLMNEDSTELKNLITASDVKHFELIVDRFCKKYNFGFFSNILNFIPGGGELADRLQLYYANKETGYDISNLELHYEIGSDIDASLLPTSTEHLDTDFGDLTDYGDLVFDATIGGDIVKEAMSKIGCAYSQDTDKRWQEGIYDCSSFIWRILASAGIDLSTICSASTAAEECRGMINAGMLIKTDDIQQGDVIFYSGSVNGRYRNVTHVAFYAGNGQIVHAANSRDGVKVGNFYKTGLVCVCRPYRSQ